MCKLMRKSINSREKRIKRHKKTHLNKIGIQRDVQIVNFTGKSVRDHSVNCTSILYECELIGANKRILSTKNHLGIILGKQYLVEICVFQKYYYIYDQILHNRILNQVQNEILHMIFFYKPIITI